VSVGESATSAAVLVALFPADRPFCRSHRQRKTMLGRSTPERLHAADILGASTAASSSTRSWPISNGRPVAWAMTRTFEIVCEANEASPPTGRPAPG
jgi:hypothetical protein